MYEGYKYTVEGSDPVIGADIPPIEIEDPGETWDLVRLLMYFYNIDGR